jgi:hypothetical protein
LSLAKEKTRVDEVDEGFTFQETVVDFVVMLLVRLLLQMEQWLRATNQ